MASYTRHTLLSHQRRGAQRCEARERPYFSEGSRKAVRLRICAVRLVYELIVVPRGLNQVIVSEHILVCTFNNTKLVKSEN